MQSAAARSKWDILRAVLLCLARNPEKRQQRGQGTDWYMGKYTHSVVATTSTAADWARVAGLSRGAAGKLYGQAAQRQRGAAGRWLDEGVRRRSSRRHGFRSVLPLVSSRRVPVAAPDSFGPEYAAAGPSGWPFRSASSNDVRVGSISTTWRMTHMVDVVRLAPIWCVGELDLPAWWQLLLLGFAVI